MKLPLLVKRLADAFSSIVGRGRGMLGGIQQSQYGTPPKRGTREFLELYDTSPWVRAAQGRCSGAVGDTEWLLTRDGDRLVPEHLFFDALHGNPMLPASILMALTQSHLDLVGDAFWLKARNGLGAPVQFWPIPPHWITATPTIERPRFVVQELGWHDEIPASEIWWAHDPSMMQPYQRGSGLVQSLGDEVQTHELASKHAAQLFFNRATPEVVVMDVGADAADVKVHERTWLQRLQGFWKIGKPYFTNRELKFWQPNSMNLENLTMVPLLKYERDAILQAYGLPPEQLGIVENSNRATAEAGDAVFEARLVRPRRRRMAMWLQPLAREYDPRLRVGFVDTTPPDKEHLLNVRKAAPWAWSRDEWRAFAGEKPGAGKDFYLVPLNSFAASDPLDLEQRPQGKTTPAPGDPA